MFKFSNNAINIILILEISQNMCLKTHHACQDYQNSTVFPISKYFTGVFEKEKENKKKNR